MQFCVKNNKSAEVVDHCMEGEGEFLSEWAQPTQSLHFFCVPVFSPLPWHSSKVFRTSSAGHSTTVSLVVSKQKQFGNRCNAVQISAPVKVSGALSQQCCGIGPIEVHQSPPCERDKSSDTNSSFCLSSISTSPRSVPKFSFKRLFCYWEFEAITLKATNILLKL